MADDADKAAEQQELMETRQIQQLRELAGRQEVGATGACLSCGELLNDYDRRWCDADCRDDWERLNA